MNSMFNFGSRNTIWHQDRIEAQAPGNASYAQVRFGFDWPDLFDGNYLVIDDIKRKLDRMYRMDKIKKGKKKKNKKSCSSCLKI